MPPEATLETWALGRGERRHVLAFRIHVGSTLVATLAGIAILAVPTMRDRDRRAPDGLYVLPSVRAVLGRSQQGSSASTPAVVHCGDIANDLLRRRVSVRDRFSELDKPTRARIAWDQPMVEKAVGEHLSRPPVQVETYEAASSMPPLKVT